jgi:REP element-mobilizing transposase RayT
MAELETTGDWTVRCAVAMPDHLHLLVTLGDSTTLTACVRRLKGALTPLLRKHGVQWQPTFFDHRLRPDEELLPVFLYIFLNPYRAKLVAPGESWAQYACRAEDWAWFSPLTRESRPMPEWLAETRVQ